MKKRFLSIFLTVGIIVVSTMVFVKMTKNHQANQLIIDECFENVNENATMVVVKGNFWSPVSCEYN